MISRINKKTSLAVFVMLSLAGHLAGGYLAGFIGPFDLRAPVVRPEVIDVSLETPLDQTAPPVTKAESTPDNGHKPALHSVADIEKKSKHASNPQNVNENVYKQAAREQVSQPPQQDLKENKPHAENAEAPVVPVENKGAENAGFSSVPLPTPEEMDKGPVRSGGEFVPSALEKLTYRIMLYGIPAGTAVLEATNKNGEVRITTRVKSNDVFSSIYPVDIFVDTRLMIGNYLLTRIRQHEGSTSGDTGFTLMLREKNAFWVDRMKKRYANIPLPGDDVMDMISGFYYLRNRRLEVGKPVVLHLFDSSKYVATTVEVLRKEHLRLPGFRESDTIVVHPILKSDGFFHSSGDIFVWLTDDERKTPVKMEAQIPLGKVTAELVSAESEKTLAAGADGIARQRDLRRPEKSPSVPLSQSGK